MQGRRAGLVSSVPSVPAPEPVDEVVVEVEAPRERLRYLRRDPEALRGPMQARSEPMTERLLETLTSVVTALAAKPAQPVTLQVAPSTIELVAPPIVVPAANVEVFVPERTVEVNVEQPAAPIVHVQNEIPEQPAPIVNVTAAAAPAAVTVEAAPAGPVVVNMPEQPAPVVNVQVDVPRPRPVRVEKQADGTVRYVPEGE